MGDAQPNGQGNGNQPAANAKADETASILSQVISKILTPASWVAAVVAFVGFTGLAFNTFLSLFVGAKAVTTSSAIEHFGAGAGLFAPGIAYLADIIVAIVYLIVFLLLLSLCLALAWRFLVFVWYRISVALARRPGPRHGGMWSGWANGLFAKPAQLPGVEARFPYLTKPFLSIDVLAGQKGRRIWRVATRLATVTALIAFVLAFGIYVPYVEATRYRDRMKDFARESLVTPAPARTVRLGELLGHPTLWLEQGIVVGETAMVRILAPFGLSEPEGAKRSPLKLPALAFLATINPKTLPAPLSYPLGWMSGGAAFLNAALSQALGLIPAADLLAEPKLVAIRLSTDKPAVMRPMLLVGEYSDSLVLYDFLFDKNLSDSNLYPLRSIKQSEVKAMTGIDPRYLVEASARDQKKQLPVIAVISAACGRDLGQDFRALAARAEECKDENNVQECVKQQFLEVDTVRCTAKSTGDPVIATPASDLEGKVASLTDAVGRLSDDVNAQHGAIAAIGIDVGNFHNELVAVSTGSDAANAAIDKLGSAVNALASNGVKVVSENAGEAPVPRILVTNATTYVIQFKEGSVSGRWDECQHLSRWDKDVDGIEFENGKSALRNDGNNDLRFSNAEATGTPWAKLVSILTSWVDEAAESPDGATSGQRILFLVGEATENGGVDRNLRLTEERARAVRSVLVDVFGKTSTNGRSLADAGLGQVSIYGKRDYPIIAIGEGESVLAPASLITKTGNRRVDAYLCHVPNWPEMTTNAKPPG